MIVKALGIIVVTASMVAVGFIVWRLLERQEARHEARQAEADGASRSDDA